jgi:transposase-like protein
VIYSKSLSCALAGYRFPREVIAVAVRWFLRYGLSYRDVEELLVERGITVDHVTVFRWVQTFTSEFIDAARPTRRSAGDRWFVDEVRHEALMRREALETEGGVSPPRRVVAAAR